MDNDKVYRYGGKGRAGARPSKGGGSGKVAVWGSLALSVGLILLAAWWLWPKGETVAPEVPENRPAPKAVKEVKPHIPKRPEPPPERVMTERERFEAAYPKGAFTNGVLRRGYNHTRIPVTNSPYATEKMPLRTTFDQLLAMATANPGMPTPPLPIDPKRLEAEFLRAVNEPVEIKEDDPPAVRELKDRVIHTRAEIKELLEKGYTVYQILREHEEISREHSEIRSSIMMERDRIAAEGDREGAETYVARMNEELRKMGIQEVGAPRTPGKKYVKPATKRE